ncbi:unnamed protein product, partial [Rotaria sp. Silwood1]
CFAEFSYHSHHGTTDGRLPNSGIESNHELTPALYNRFLIIHYQGFNLSSLDTYRNLFSSYFPTDQQKLINYICEQMQSEQLTIRQLV